MSRALICGTLALVLTSAQGAASGSFPRATGAYPEAMGGSERSLEMHPGAKVVAAAEAKDPPKCDSLPRPATPREFFVNVRDVYDRGLLNCEAFYKASVLETAFGGSKTSTFGPLQNVTTWNISNLGSLFQEAARAWAAGVYVYRVEEPAQRGQSLAVKRAHLSVGVGYDSRLTSEFAQSIFGRSFQISNPYKIDRPTPEQLRHPRPIPSKTVPLGNLELTYMRSDDQGSHSVEIRLNGDGTIQQLTVSFEGGKNARDSE